MSKESQLNLLPCPFCGSDAEELEFKPDPGFYFGCNNPDCGISPGASSGEYEDKQSAISAWNTRVTTEEQSS